MRAALAALTCSVALTACFDPTLPAVACGERDQCPTGTSCAPDGFCRAPSDVSDAASGAADAPIDAVQVDAPVSSSGLVDRSLVFRYFLDEGTQSNPTVVADSGPGTPFDLDVVPSAEMSFTTVPGQSGLTWSGAGLDGRAEHAIGFSKVLSQLAGTTTVTLEVVVDMQAYDANGSRIVHVGQGTAQGLLALRARNATAYEVAIGDVVVETFDVASLPAGRRVFQVVANTTLPTSGDRLRGYVDGVEVAGTEIATIPIGALTSLDPNDVLVLGNRTTGGRSFQGSLDYAAAYSSALTMAELQANAARLMTNDDP